MEKEGKKELEELEILFDGYLKKDFKKGNINHFVGNLNENKIILAINVINNSAMVYELIIKENTEAILTAQESLIEFIREINTEKIKIDGLSIPEGGLKIPAYVVFPDKMGSSYIKVIEIYDGANWAFKFTVEEIKDS